MSVSVIDKSPSSSVPCVVLYASKSNNEGNNSMTTAIVMNTLMAQAVRRDHDRDREVTYRWRSPKVDIAHDNGDDLWGEQIELAFRHDAKRKQYEATIRLVHWQPHATMTVTSFTVFDFATYPASKFATQAVGRYGDKSFAEFERVVIASLDEYDDYGYPAHDDGVLTGLLARANAFTE